MNEPLYRFERSRIVRGLFLLFESDVNVSYYIESKPRIDNIDYDTYVLGAMDSWLGFTFLMLNPVLYCMKIKPSNISRVTESDIFKVSYVEHIRLSNGIGDIENNTSESNAEFDQIFTT